MERRVGTKHRAAGGDGRRAAAGHHRPAHRRSMRRHMLAREGFALAAVLWVLTVAAVLAAGTALVGRQAYAASRNRVNQERAYWTAEGCLAELRSLADVALASADPSQLTQIWRNLDRD